MNLRWYERLWQRVPSGTRARLAASLYLLTGLLAIVLAAISSTGIQLAGWAVLAVVMVGLGTSLWLTLLRRR